MEKVKMNTILEVENEGIGRLGIGISKSYDYIIPNEEEDLIVIFKKNNKNIIDILNFKKYGFLHLFLSDTINIKGLKEFLFITYGIYYKDISFLKKGYENILEGFKEETNILDEKSLIAFVFKVKKGFIKNKKEYDIFINFFSNAIYSFLLNYDKGIIYEELSKDEKVDFEDLKSVVESIVSFFDDIIGFLYSTIDYENNNVISFSSVIDFRKTIER